MKREWTDLELTEHWTLLPAEAAPMCLILEFVQIS
jgi:hypothetical protein